ncbi:MAG TPA: DUF1254 domain-containing protein, partial [Stellaceae bacterium]|nr:DUF1254 domain-containing protein [Stellaceae bacterium]
MKIAPAIIASLLPIACLAAHPAPIGSAQPSLLDDYIYGYAPVAVAAVRSLMTAVPDATSSPGRAPINQLARVKRLATPAARRVPRPNADTLFTLAWLDLSNEPIILHVPAMADRYYLIPLYDAYSNEFASIGSRTTGNGEGDFALAGPAWKLPPPAGLRIVRAPTNTVWLIGRTLVRGQSDLPAAIALADRYQLIPLSAYSQFLATGNYSPPTNVPATPLNPDFVAAPITRSPGFFKPEFFDALAMIASQNPPPAAVAPQADALVRHGLARKDELTPALIAEATSAMVHDMKARRTQQNGWSVDLTAGDYGSDYLHRAAIARFGLGANIAADAIYPSTAIDGAGEPLVGAKNYVIHFPPGATPPVRGFWSLTVYDRDGFLVANPINRYTVGSETALVRNPDGSLDILLQNTAPKTLATNWLPT